MSVKTGIGVITCDRLDYLKQCIEHLQTNNWGGAEHFIVVDDYSTDGTQEWIKENISTFVLKPENKGVAHSKNVALKSLMDMGCERLFLIEDDILMKHPETCNLYAQYAATHELEHLNFAHHGLKNDRKLADYEGVTVYPACIGAFSFYTRNCIERIGLMDENFYNALEHVHHTWRIANAGLTTPFWKFADHPDSRELLEEIPDSIENSVIRREANWQESLKKAEEYWMQKEGCPLPKREFTPLNQSLPQTLRSLFKRIQNLF